VGTVVGIAVLVGIVVVATAISRARTTARKDSNSAIKTSLTVSSSREVEQIRDAITQGLKSAGVQQTGSFDHTQFFRVNSALQLDLKVWAENGRTRATLAVPAVRQVAGRPVKLGPVGPAVAVAENAVRSLDPQANIT
jgi:hypothetical protein